MCSSDLSTLISDNEISEFRSQGSGGIECSDSPDISSFSSSAGVSDSLKALKQAIIPSYTVAVVSIVKRSKAVPGAGIQKKKGK